MTNIGLDRHFMKHQQHKDDQEASGAALKTDHQDEKSSKDSEKPGCNNCLVWIIALIVVTIWRWEDLISFFNFIIKIV